MAQLDIATLPEFSALDRAIIEATGLLPGKAGYRQFGFVELFTPDGYNPKTKKGRARGYSTAILHFAPANLSGYDVCQYRSAGCTASCLNTAGHGGIKLDINGLNDVQRARIARTRLFFLNRFVFNVLLVKSIEKHVRRARKNGLIPAVRLNGTSDLPWEKLRLNDGRTVLETFPDVQFYDYTKHPERAVANAEGKHPANYHLTFSRSESNAADVDRVLAAGANVATVLKFCQCKRTCKHDIPENLEVMHRLVVNGDHDDLRFLDQPGVWVGLKAKGRARVDTTGFVLSIDPDRDPLTDEQYAHLLAVDEFETRDYISARTA